MRGFIRVPSSEALHHLDVGSDVYFHESDVFFSMKNFPTYSLLNIELL